jgi:GT2 family glycosyltransferase
MNKKPVSIVIPNYNGRKLFEQYLPFTIQAIENANVEYEIIIVDDCSKDDSILFLEEHYPLIKIIKNESNKGFSFSCNEGITAAKKDLILILNSDVKLSPNYFESLWGYFEHENTFGVMGRIMDMDGDHIQDAARMPKFNAFKIKTAYFYFIEGDHEVFTLYLSGANALIDAKKLKAIGGFNLMFSPFYGEDFELSLRAWRLNWCCYYEHQATCGHLVSASTKDYKTARWVKMIYFRNRYFLHALHLNRTSLFFWFLQITFIDLLPKIISGKFWIWTSYFTFIKSFRKIEKERKLFAQLQMKNDVSTPLNEVFNKIEKSVQGKQLIRLKDQ